MATQVSNKMIWDKLDGISKMLLGNGEIGLCEHVRNNSTQLSEQAETIKYIKENYTRRQADKWSKTKKITVASIVITNIGAILAALNWVNSVLEPLRAAIIP